MLQMEPASESLIHSADEQSMQSMSMSIEDENNLPGKYTSILYIKVAVHYD